MTAWSTSTSSPETATLERATRAWGMSRRHTVLTSHRLSLTIVTGVRVNTRVSTQNSSLQTGEAGPISTALVIQRCVMHALLQTLTEPLNLK